MLKLSFPTRKLKGSLIKITDKYKNFENKTLQAYGVTNKEGIVITGKNISDDTSNYTVITGKTFVYNPYRINVGSIGLTDDDFKGIVSPAYVAFKVKDDILPEFLLLYLKSSLGINLIKWYGDRGGVRSALRFNDLEKIDFPDLSYEQQEEALKNINKFIKIQNTLNQEMENQITYISKFRQSILQDAIQGKLVPQDPTDEPASELLKKIKEKKEQLIKEGKIKKEKNIQLPVNKNSEIPNGWIICALGEIGNAIDSPIVDGPFGSSINTNTDYISNGVPVIRMMNIKPLNYIGNNLKFVSENKFNGLKRHNVIPNDILFSKVGAGIGECCIYPATEKEGMLSTTGVIRFRVGEMVISKYLCYFLLAKKDYFLEIASQTAQPFLNMSMIKNTEFLLPPKEEQKRIVARLDELMQLCDKLENENNNAQKYSSELLQSIMQKYFTPEV